MKIILALLIFCLVLFMYLHVFFHLKTSNELELYEIDDVSKDKFEEICDLRQPVLFQFDCRPIMETVHKFNILNQYAAFDVKIRTREEEDSYVNIPFHSAVKLFDNDKKSCFFTENNSDFLQETTFIKNLNYNDAFLRPYMVSNCNYDILFGSENCCTPFRYELNYRTFFLLTAGKAQIKLAPPQSIKYVNPVYDYENFEFRSPMNPWSPQMEYKADFSKMKCLEFSLDVGKTLFLPAYWWYSIRLEKDAFISCFRYRTYMNTIAISPYIALYALQNQNIKREFAKKANIQELESKKNIEPKMENEKIETKETTSIDDLPVNNEIIDFREKENVV